jgi:hypothetical protein
MSSPDIAELRHGANVLRALARNLEPELAATGAPLDHESARDAVTLLGWRGEATSETLQLALGLSPGEQLFTGSSRPSVGARHAPATATSGSGHARAVGPRVGGRSRGPVEAALREAVRPEELSRFVAALTVATAVLGDTRTPRGSAGPAT